MPNLCSDTVGNARLADNPAQPATHIDCISPGSTDGAGFRASLTDDEVKSVLPGCEADLVCGTHAHCPLRTQVCGVDLVNIWGVSNPVLPDLLARCVLLDAGRAGYRVEYRSVRYDREAVIAAAHGVRYSGAE